MSLFKKQNKTYINISLILITLLILLLILFNLYKNCSTTNILEGIESENEGQQRKNASHVTYSKRELNKKENESNIEYKSRIKKHILLELEKLETKVKNKFKTNMSKFDNTIYTMEQPLKTIAIEMTYSELVEFWLDWMRDGGGFDTYNELNPDSEELQQICNTLNESGTKFECNINDLFNKSS